MSRFGEDGIRTLTRPQLEIQQLSRDAAPDVDGWVRQAKQLQLDIERSRITARHIIQEAEEASRLRAQHDDLKSKVQLLREEVNYSGRLKVTLDQIQSVAVGLNHARSAVQEGDFNGALDRLYEVEAGLVVLRPYETSQSVDLLTQRATKMKRDLIEDVWKDVDDFIQVENSTSTITINEEMNEKNGKSTVSLNSMLAICSRLTLVDSVVERLCRDLDNVILKPRLGAENNAQVPRIERNENKLRAGSKKPNTGALDALDDMVTTASFFHDLLPSEVSVALSEVLMPTMLSYLLSSWLPSSMPLSVERTDELEVLLTRTSQFAKDLADIGWTGQRLLNDWVDAAPRHWISRRREFSLASVRTILSKQTKLSKTVERVETQTVSRDDAIAPTDGSHEDWDAGWSDEESKSTKADSVVVSKPAEDEAEETSAWEVEDEDDVAPTSPKKSTVPSLKANEPEADDEGNAWGWTEGDTSSTPASPVAVRSAAPLPQTRRKSNGQKQLTLRETYTTTLVPESLFELIAALIHDSETLRSASYKRSPIASAASVLTSLPTLIVASFRALAPTFYAIESPTPGAGNMYMYNDASYLAEQLTGFAATQGAGNSRLKLDADIDALQAFSRRAYGREMDNQRTILRDLLDGAQGFINCTEPPFAAACTDAVNQTVDRIRDVSRMWAGVLSKGALLQSLGSLLSTVLSKVILEIEELGDIGENESAKLRGFCTTISTLSDLFKTPGAGNTGEAQDLTGVYAPQWFKFQYLAEILEASLADIKYLWQQGELSLEFDKEELIELMQALFAESDHRRRAIAEIRRD